MKALAIALASASVRCCAATGKSTVATNNISIDLAESKDFYYLQAYLAGIEKEDISIEATNNSVTIKACFENILKNIEDDEAAVIVSGIKEGAADRTVTLTEDIVKEEITAKHNNGNTVLEFTSKEARTEEITLKKIN